MVENDTGISTSLHVIIGQVRLEDIQFMDQEKTGRYINSLHGFFPSGEIVQLPDVLKSVSELMIENDGKPEGQRILDIDQKLKFALTGMAEAGIILYPSDLKPAEFAQRLVENIRTITYNPLEK
ncbi:MAG: hypothetical protein AAB546_01355 [Patescibacteria group bacterium]